MKKLYLIGGTMGVGKTTVCRYMKEHLDRCVFLDGDWCWDQHPFTVNRETKAMVMENICFLLNNFIRCSEYENIIFCWVMHEQSIIDDIKSRLELEGVEFIPVSLMTDAQELAERLKKDIAAGIRTPDIIERSTQRLELYKKLDTVKIDVVGKTVEETAEMILSI